MKFAVAVVLVSSLVCPLLAEEPPEPQGQTVVRNALGQLGNRYRWGGRGERGFDCAGLVQRSFESVGIELPRTAADQYDHGCVVEEGDLAPGDLVFFRNTYKRGISHVGIYIGDGQFVHAASSQGRVVVDGLDEPYYRKRFAGARRVLQGLVSSVAAALR